MLRYQRALLLMVCLPPLLLHWLILHGFVRFWHRPGSSLSLGLVWTVLGL